MINLQQFKSRVVSPQRDNRFELTFLANPSGGYQLPEDLRLIAEGVTFPQVEITPYTINRYGFGVLDQLAGRTGYKEIVVDFITQTGGYPLNHILNWMNYINPSMAVSSQGTSGSERGLFTTEYKDNYVATVYITMLHENGNNGDGATRLELYQAWPMTLTGTPLAWSREGYHQMQLTLCFYRLGMHLGDGIASTQATKNLSSIKGAGGINSLVGGAEDAARDELQNQIDNAIGS